MSILLLFTGDSTSLPVQSYHSMCCVRCLMLPYCSVEFCYVQVYVTIIPRARVGYEMIDSQQDA